MRFTFVFISLLALILSSCGRGENASILEVTTFNINSGVSMQDFAKLDAEVEGNFTSLQNGFISRQSAVDEKGNVVVLVYWESEKDAKASMDKFMADQSVQEYAAMINASTMKMNRFMSRKRYSGSASSFVEVMSFDLKDGVDSDAFREKNKQVETEVTAKRDGFIERITGRNDDGKIVVAIYWDTKENSDAALQPFQDNPISKEFMGMMDQSSIQFSRYQFTQSLKSSTMELSNRDKVVALLNSFNTGDKTPISYINPNKYIQHNLAVGDGLAGFGEVMQHAPPGGFKANVIRSFEDGDFVFTHTEYDFFGPKIGFDVFRFEDGLIVEHWDNLIDLQKPNPSGRTQIDGATEITDLDKTEANKAKAQDFINTVLLEHKMDQVTNYINPTKYIQHNPAVADGLEGFGAAMKYFAEKGLVMEYTKLHKVLGEGNFVLTLSEGKFGKGEHTAFYDLFRFEDGLIVEHWDVIAPIPAKEEWKNTNGKF